MDDIIFNKVEADLNLKKLEEVISLGSKIRMFKEQHKAEIIQTEHGFKLKGSLKSIIEFGKICHPQNETEKIKGVYVLSRKTENVEDVERFLGGTEWGDVEDEITSNVNIPFTPVKVCHLLLDKKDQIMEILHAANARLKVKDSSNDKLRLKVEKTKMTAQSGVQVDDELKKLCEASTTGMSEIDFSINDLMAPKSLVSEVLAAIQKRGVAYLTRDQEDLSKWKLSILVLNSFKDKAAASIKDIIERYSQKSKDVGKTLRELCDHSLPPVKENEQPHIYPDLSNDLQNEEKGKEPIPKVIEQTKPKDETCHIFVGDEEVIDYIIDFKDDKIQGIKDKYGVEIGLSKKNEGILILKSKPSDLEKANLKFTHLAQDMIQTLRTERIDISAVDKASFKMRKIQAFEAAKQMGFLIRKENETTLFIVGPGHLHSECIRTVKNALGLSTPRRRVLTSSTMGPESIIVRPKANPAPAHLPLQSPLTSTPLQKVYVTKDNNSWILAWVTDITKLNVDIVVNAANEQLAHGGGVAYAISNAAGKELEKECKKHIKNYGELAITDLCLTTSGYMPCKKVMHTVGPRWGDYRDKHAFQQDLCKTFYGCLDRAQANGYQSIALPAISSGIFGGPKEVVVDMAVTALLAFGHKFPFSKLKWIHFVDVLPDIIVCFHERLNACVGQGHFMEDKTYGDYDKWMGDSSNSHKLSYSGRNSATKDGKGNTSLNQNALLHNGNTNHGYGGQKLPGATKTPNSQLYADTYTDDEDKSEDMEWQTTGDSTNPGNDIGAQGDGNNGNNPKSLQNALNDSYAEVLKGSGKMDMPKVHTASRSTPTDSKKTDKASESKTNETEEEDTCSICMDKPRNPKTLPKCKHTFCKECIDKCFIKMNPKCPNCGVVYGELKGDQPSSGTMKVSRIKSSLPGYDGCDTIQIKYYFPDGTQGKNHSHPGIPYHGTSRAAYLPGNKEGQKVLKLLKKAFDAQMVFTVGRSSTTNMDDCVIWNCIHHKTRQTGGPQSYGYPDPTYLNRVQEELAAQGFK